MVLEREWFRGKYAINDKWLRITHNPVVEGYPKSGEVIKLDGHAFLNNGEYLVTDVQEFEPGYVCDSNGRDIRITLVSRNGSVMPLLDGSNILKAMKREG
jgi:hypothetical protein